MSRLKVKRYPLSYPDGAPSHIRRETALRTRAQGGWPAPPTGTGAGVHGRLWVLVGAPPAALLSAVRRRARGLPGQAGMAARDVGHEGQAGHRGGQSVPKAWPNKGVQAIMEPHEVLAISQESVL